MYSMQSQWRWTKVRVSQAMTVESVGIVHMHHDVTVRIVWSTDQSNIIRTGGNASAVAQLRK